MKFSAELIKGSTKNIILAVLCDGEMYGYQIVKTIKAKSSDLLEFGEGSIYPALHALEQDGFLKGRWVIQQNSPDRKYYTITLKGRIALKSALKEWMEFSQAINAIFTGQALSLNNN